MTWFEYFADFHLPFTRMRRTTCQRRSKNWGINHPVLNVYLSHFSPFNA